MTIDNSPPKAAPGPSYSIEPELKYVLQQWRKSLPIEMGTNEALNILLRIGLQAVGGLAADDQVLTFEESASSQYRYIDGMSFEWSHADRNIQVPFLNMPEVHE